MKRFVFKIYRTGQDVSSTAWEFFDDDPERLLFRLRTIYGRDALIDLKSRTVVVRKLDKPFPKPDYCWDTSFDYIEDLRFYLSPSGHRLEVILKYRDRYIRGEYCSRQLIGWINSKSINQQRMWQIIKKVLKDNRIPDSRFHYIQTYTGYLKKIKKQI